MKTRLAILAVLAATAGISTGATANDMLAPPAPDAGDGKLAYLYPSEQGAFKALEVATQVVESSIVQFGCNDEEYAFQVKTDLNGKGTASVDGVNLKVTPLPYNGDGRAYNVEGGGTLATVNTVQDPLIVTELNALGSYNIGSQIQEVETNFKVSSNVSDLPDTFRGTIIKDYIALTTSFVVPQGFASQGRNVYPIIDYGYQQIQKNGYPVDKYWQQSQFWRQNGVKPGLIWKKTSVTGETACSIEVILKHNAKYKNFDNYSGFAEIGIIKVVTDGGSAAGTYKN